MSCRYKNLFFDLDDTLWAFSANARDTFEEMYHKYGYNRFFSSFGHFYQLYQKRNVELWEEYGQGRVTKEEWNRQRFLYPLEQVGKGDAGLENCVRIFPRHMAGEGHFLALFKKEGASHSIALGSPSSKIEKSSKKHLEGFFMGSSVSLDRSRIEIRGGHVYCLPKAGPESVKGIKFLRWGLYLGELKKNRF